MRGWEKLQAEPVCSVFSLLFRWQKKEKLFKVFLIWTFIPWLLDYLDVLRYGSESSKIYLLQLMLLCLRRNFESIFSWGEGKEWSVVNFFIKRLVVDLFMYIRSYTDVLHADIFLFFIDFLYNWVCCCPCTLFERTKGKQNYSEKIQRPKMLRVSLKANDISQWLLATILWTL